MIVKPAFAPNVQDLFPRIYQEDAPEFIEFVKTYYEHLDAVLAQDYFKYTDLDETAYRFLNYFNRKYLANIELPPNANPRIIIKHITDLYKRKGSEESIRLLFKLFFDEEIELFYPSSSILSPSNSLYFYNSYIEMRPVYTPLEYDLQKGMRILGQTTRATAYIEEVLFKNFDGIIVPLVFLSNLIGQFTIDDRIIILDNNGDILRFSTETIAGSVSGIEFSSVDDSSPNNTVGDEYNIITINPNIPGGYYGRAMASEVTSATSGSVKLTVEEGGYGYTLPTKLSSGRLAAAIDASGNDVSVIQYLPNDLLTPIPVAGNALRFYNDVKFYRIQDVTVQENTSGAPAPYALTVLSGVVAADEGDIVTIRVTTDGTIPDGTTVTATITGDVEIEDYVHFLPGANTGTVEFTISGNEAAVDIVLIEDARTDGLETFIITLDEFDSASTPTNQPSVQFIINDTSVASGGGTSISPSISVYNITLDETVEIDLPSNTPIETFDGDTITDLYISNQVIEIDPVSIAKLTLDQIADEVERLANGLSTPSNTSDSTLIELWAYLNSYDSVGNKIADINGSGIVSIIDVYIIRNAHLGDFTSLQQVGDRFDAYTKGSFNDRESISWYDSILNKSSSGIVVKYEEPLLYIQTSQYKSFPENLDPENTIQIVREDFSEFTAKVISPYNASAKFELSSLGDYTENVDVVITKCNEFFNTTISSVANNIINQSLDYKEFTIGEIGSFRTLDSGVGYNNETFFSVNQRLFSTFDKHDFYVIFKNIDIVLFTGDEMTQIGFDFAGNPYTARAIFLRREGDRYYFRLKSFYEFIDNTFVTIQGLTFDLHSVVYLNDTPVIGDNADIASKTSYGKGQITKVKIIDTGYKYIDGADVRLVNDDGKIVATGTLSVTGTGFSKGQWKTSASNLNSETRVIQDSYYYQQYSFDLGTSISPDRYKELVRDTVQVAGTKMFATPLINTYNDVAPNVTTEIQFFEIKKEPYITESETGSQSPRYPEQNIVTEEGNPPILQSENLVTVETVALTTLTI